MMTATRKAKLAVQRFYKSEWSANLAILYLLRFRLSVGNSSLVLKKSRRLVVASPFLYDWGLAPPPNPHEMGYTESKGDSLTGEFIPFFRLLLTLDTNMPTV